MIVDKKKFKLAVTDLVMILISIFFAVGVRFWFPVCEVMGETVMSCHWAGEVLKAFSILYLVLCVAHIFIPDGRIKTGISISLIGISVLAILIPGTIVNICKDSMMLCHMTRMGTIIFGILWVLAVLADIVFWTARESKKKHKRPAAEE